MLKSAHSKKRLQPLQMQAIGMLSMGEKQVVVVERVGVAQATLTRWMKSPAFVTELDKRLSEAREDSIRELKTFHLKAVATIDRALTDPMTPINVAVQVAFKILELTAPEIAAEDTTPRTLDPEKLARVTAEIYGL